MCYRCMSTCFTQPLSTFLLWFAYLSAYNFISYQRLQEDTNLLENFWSQENTRLALTHQSNISVLHILISSITTPLDTVVDVQIEKFCWQLHHLKRYQPFVMDMHIATYML